MSVTAERTSKMDEIEVCVNDIVADQFRPYGLCRVQSGVAVWGLDYPAKAKF